MRLKKRINHWVFVFFTIGICLSLGWDTSAEDFQTAPDFNLKDLSGYTVSLEQYRGNIVLLDFWATWCPPCKMSIPELVDLNNRYRDKGLVILGISVDDPDQINDKRLRTFKKRFKMNYVILRANEKVIQDYFTHQRMGIPTIFIINREGKIVDIHVGFRPGALEKALLKVL